MNNLIPNDYARCANLTCDIKESCKRHLQVALDKENNNTYVWYNLFENTKEKYCQFYIKN